MSKRNGMEVEPLGLHKPEVLKKIPTKLDRIEEKFEKPEIEITFGDRLAWYGTKVGDFLIDKGAEFAGKTLGHMLKPYLLWILVVVIIATAAIIIF